MTHKGQHFVKFFPELWGNFGDHSTVFLEAVIKFYIFVGWGVKEKWSCGSSVCRSRHTTKAIAT